MAGFLAAHRAIEITCHLQCARCLAEGVGRGYVHGCACTDQLAYIGWLEICYRADRTGLCRHSQLHPGVQALAGAGAQSPVKTTAVVQVSNLSLYLCKLCISAKDHICRAPHESAISQSRPKLCKQVFVMICHDSLLRHFMSPLHSCCLKAFVFTICGSCRENSGYYRASLQLQAFLHIVMGDEKMRSAKQLMTDRHAEP